MNMIGYPIRVLSATVVFVAILTSSTVSGRTVSCSAANIVGDAGSAFIGAAHRRSAPAFASALARYADVNAIAMSALGQYKRALPHAQRAEYLANTKLYISRFLLEKSGAFKNSQKLTIDGCDGNLVKTSFDGRSRIVWRLSGGRIADVQVNGVWLALQLRSKFTSIVRRNQGDVNGLLAFLRG